MNNKVLDEFKKFLSDKDTAEMFIVGRAGTGKTTSLNAVLQYVLVNNISHIVCAYTHKAVEVLKEKLPLESNFSTLHSFLTKCPTINENALKLSQVDKNFQRKKPEVPHIIFVDEFSMIGKKDYISLTECQYHEQELIAKVVYIGDMNQLSPVNDIPAVYPKDNTHNVYLTKIYRQANTNPLSETLAKLASYIDEGQMDELPEHETFIKNSDLASSYKAAENAVILAYTNEKVQFYNQLVEGKTKYEKDDKVYSPTLKLKGWVGDKIKSESVTSIVPIFGDSIELKSKFKTLETLVSLKLEFVRFVTENTTTTRCVIFGHKDYLDKRNLLKSTAVNANKQCAKYAGKDIVSWCRTHSNHKLAKFRNKAWREFLSFDKCVICLDFCHAITVHKAQGSTYNTVCIDGTDIEKCAQYNYSEYMKLLYVAISRASEKVFIT